ncbi:MAG: MG2 domain-containing protein, partial [Anaerolineae bacterium]|nr:MG2 domain-containing protein [Anaerolineae bacterium]
MNVQDHTADHRRRRPVLATALHLGIGLLVLAGFAGLWWVRTLPGRIDDQQTIILGQTRFAPDSDASVRVVVRDLGAGKPIVGASVRVSLMPAGGQAVPLYEGVTDESGSLPVSFHIPADAPAEAELIVETQSPAGRDRLAQPVTIERDYRLLMTSDKPLYQPGQMIHMRALALSTFDLSPARGATVDFLVEDAKGNKVFRQSVVSSDFGVVAVDFQLADMVNQGDYKLSAAIGDTRSEKTVEVRPYVLPKFGVNVSTDRSFYLPGQRVDGTIQADYFFGKPVANSDVHIVGSVWDVDRSVAVDLVGETDAAGTYAFSFYLPEYFAGSDLEFGQAQFLLEVTVVDQTDHSEQTSLILPVAAQPLIIEAAAESGLLKPGVENVLYVLTAYPDGRPAPASLQISVNGAAPLSLEGGELGLAQFTFTPTSDTDHWVSIVARDAAGLTAQRQLGLSVEYGYDTVLLRADRAAYLVGETMDLIALTSVDAGSIYLDIVKAGQTLSTRSATVVGGKAEFAVDVTSDLYGTLELHAYKVLSDGSIVRDTRVVIVDTPNELAIDVTSDSDTYLPGDIATIALQTSDAAGGTGVQTTLGLAIVDESVFALQRQDPGFAKLYFLLRKELMEPFYQVRGFQVPSLIYTAEEPATGDILRQAQDGAAKAAWADFPVSIAGALNSRDDKMSAAYSAQNRGYELIGLLSTIGLIAGPLALLAIAIGALWNSGMVKRSVGRLLVLIGVVVFLA